MSLSSGAFLGFDPGGENRFGVAMISGRRISFETVSTIKEAVDWSVAACDGKEPNAAGIDTILHWGTGRSGYRSADLWLRESYPDAARSVMAPNSLYGAMTIGGVGLAIELKNRWPNLSLNETHPKVLYYALSGFQYPRGNLTDACEWLARRARFELYHPRPSEDEFDAILSAWATREALASAWIDLAEVDDRHIYPISNVRYLWPALK